MRKTLTMLFIGLGICPLLFAKTAKQENPLDLVNTLQGSYNTPEFSHGRCSPVVALPHGMVQWSPEGFNYVEKKISGLSNGAFSISPLAGREDLDSENFSGSFAPKDILGKPQLFKVTNSSGTTCEITPTEHGAALRFSFSKSSESILALRATSNVNRITIDPNGRRISGYVSTLLYNEKEWYKTYFVIEFDQDFVDYGIVGPDGELSSGGNPSEEGEGLWAYVSFKKNAKVNVLSAISRISQEQAEVSFSREVSGKSFEQILQAAEADWSKRLGKIKVEGGTLEQRKTFYSCLYRASLRPSRNYETDAQGQDRFYLKGLVHEGRYHTSPILWDAFRCLFALQNIIDTEEQNDYVQSLQKMKPLTGWWPSGHVMIGNHAISVFAEAWAKGIRSFDPEKVLELYMEEITHSNPDLVNQYNVEHQRGDGRMKFEDYFSLGYIPYPQNTIEVMETTARTLEYTYDDFCAYRLAEMIGNDFYSDIFSRQINNYKNVFDPSDRFMKGRDKTGAFDTDFNPYEWGGAFVEGNGWQWKWSVFHDVQGYIDLMGGEDQFSKDLDALFAAPADSVLYGGYGFMIHEINEAVANGIGQYPPGNEPSFHIPYLYDYAGLPWKCQEIIRSSLQENFTSEPDGFPGDEDGGAMSAYYILSSMGFYSVTPSVAQYAIGSPLFDKVTISLEDGKSFVISAVNNGPENVYIQNAVLNGTPYSHNYLDHSDIINGGELIFEMGNTPNTQRGILEQDKPFSESK